ncbi:AMP-binding protein, partial [Streptomyces platensis]|uniref:AMP-binding protein n=1 Tax=Streptomyces platensis TaxID=58346 RepID=UPI00368E4135
MHDDVDARADLEYGVIPRLVRVAARRYGSREAVVEGRTRVTYAELGERVERAAAACIASGVAPGDRVAVWAPNTLDWIVSALGAVAAGAVLVPVNTRFKGTEAAYVLRRTRARLLFITGTFLGTSYLAALRRAAREGTGPGPLPGLPRLEKVVVLSDDAPADCTTWQEFLADGAAVPAETVRARADALRSDAPSDIVFTSGTTGRPKGAVITHAQTLRAYDVWSELAGLREGDRYLIINPFFHTFGYKAGIIACLLRGATMIPQPVFSVETALAKIAAERISVLPGPPTLHQQLLDHPARGRHDLSALRLVVTGAAVVPLELVERLRSELKISTVLTAYGLSESSGVVTMCRGGGAPPPPPPPTRPGRPRPPGPGVDAPRPPGPPPAPPP